MTTLDELIAYHEERKERAEAERLLGTVSEEEIRIYRLKEIKAKPI